ncbi:MAG: hypothetical protein ACLGHJ_05200 [Gammaproteobacteria bacterium]
MKLKALVAGVLAAGGLVAGSAFAVTADGPVQVGAAAVAPGSIGTADVELTVTPVIQVQIVNDLSVANGTELADDGVMATVTGSVELCVWGRSSLGTFGLAATSANGGTLNDGAGNNIPYTFVESATTGTALSKASDCALGTPNATVDVTVTRADIDDFAGPDSSAVYSDELTVTVVAE